MVASVIVSNAFIFSCACPKGFEGARCQQLSHSFSGNGWAWYNPLAGCEDDTLSIEFATTQLDGLILFNGTHFKIIVLKLMEIKS